MHTAKNSQEYGLTNNWKVGHPESWVYGKKYFWFWQGSGIFRYDENIFPFSDFLSSSNTVIIESGFFFVMGIVKKVQYFENHS